MSAFDKAGAFLFALRKGCEAHRVPYASALSRALRLYATGKFSRKEIVGYALYAPSITQTMPVLISKERSLERLGRFNPPALQHLTENKDEFYTLCRAHGLPIPATYGWTIDASRYDADGAPVDGTSAWADYLRGRLPEHFIVKDRAGAYGSGFAAFQRVGDTFRVASNGTVLDVGGLVEAIARAGGSEGVVIQERLYDAAALSALCGRRGLQTMRVNTLLGADGEVSILFYMIKILAGQTLSDNFSMGTTGNLIAFGDDRGVLRGALTMHACGSGITVVRAHPATAVPFDGFALPHWSEAIDLAKAGQRCFPMLPTLGWDVALTDAGPRIVEANARWDPPLYAPFLMTAEHWTAMFGHRDDD